MAKATNYNMMKRIEKLEDKIEDSGWKNLKLESGVIAHNKRWFKCTTIQKNRKSHIYTWSGRNKLGWRKPKNYCCITRAVTGHKIQHILLKHLVELG